MATTLNTLPRLAKRATKAQEAADAALAARDAAIVAVRESETPPTYQQIADATGISKDRVNQIIQRHNRATDRPQRHPPPPFRRTT